MKRSLLLLSAIALFGVLAAPAQNNQGQNGSRPRPRTTVNEAGVLGMLALSAGSIAAGLVLKRRKND
jgi:hypothetical protein